MQFVWQKQRVARQQLLAFFVELFGLIHLAAFLFTTALQVSEPASTVDVS